MSAAFRMRILPTSVEPVNEILRTRRSSIRTDASAGASWPTTTDSTPLGSPTSSKMRAISSAVRG